MCCADDDQRAQEIHYSDIRTGWENTNEISLCVLQAGLTADCRPLQHTERSMSTGHVSLVVERQHLRVTLNERERLNFAMINKFSFRTRPISCLSMSTCAITRCLYLS